MSHSPFGDPRHLTLHTKWVEAYTDFVTSSLGLRALLKVGSSLGVNQTLMAGKVRHLLEVSDELNAFGFNPTIAFAGEEADLWLAATRYGTAGCWELLARPTDLGQMIRAVEDSYAAWGEFLRVVQSVSDDFANTVPVLAPSNLRPERLDRLFQPCVQRPRPLGGDDHGQAVAQQLDQPILR